MNRWSVAAGRQIYFDGKPFIEIDRTGNTEPVEADGAVVLIVSLLNQSNMTPDDIWALHMGHPRRKPKHAREVRETGDRPISMTYGTLPPFTKFMRDIRRPDPDYEDGRAYWPEGTLYPMELVSEEEIALAEDYGGLTSFTPLRFAHKSGFRGDEQAIYGFLQYLVDAFNDGNEEAGDLASSIMTTLGYEWI